MSYRLGLTPAGEVVHIYDDGERIVMHKPGTPPKVAHTVGTVHPSHPAHPDNFGAFASDLAHQLAGAKRNSASHPDDAQSHEHQLALQHALALFQSQLGA